MKERVDAFLGPSGEKLPVPGPWQIAVRAAMADLVRTLGLPAQAVTVTRVVRDPAGGLEIWLLAGGRTRRYRAADPGAEPRFVLPGDESGLPPPRAAAEAPGA